jgi:hypothetical protein
VINTLCAQLVQEWNGTCFNSSNSEENGRDAAEASNSRQFRIRPCQARRHAKLKRRGDQVVIETGQTVPGVRAHDGRRTSQLAPSARHDRKRYTKRQAAFNLESAIATGIKRQIQ